MNAVIEFPSTDRAWFRKNKDRDTRLRLPTPGEVETIMRRSLPSDAYEVAAMGGAVSPPDPSVKWAVAV